MYLRLTWEYYCSHLIQTALQAINGFGLSECSNEVGHGGSAHSAGQKYTQQRHDIAYFGVLLLQGLFDSGINGVARKVG